jgi:probable rRNA maturation factor
LFGFSLVVRHRFLGLFRFSDFRFRISATMPATRILTLRNRQRTRPIDLPQLRRLARALLEHLLDQQAYDLGIYFVAAPEMTRLNETFLHHQGSTDVITFDYSETSASVDASPRPRGTQAQPPSSPLLHGEIFVCVDEAVRQARRFRTSWQSELVRYLVHGLLHLRGYDDNRASARRIMKREEDRLVCLLSAAA